MNDLLLFASSFLSIFLMGFQQLNVEHRKYALSFITSFAMTFFNYCIFKLLPSGGFDLLQFFSFAFGGALGIVLAMVAHDKLIPKK